MLAQPLHLCTQNVAFISENTSSTNEVYTAYGASTSSGHNPQREGSSSYTDELMYSFFANQSSGPQLDHEDLEQLDEFDLEEMDLKWQVAMISMRLKKFYKKTGRKLQFDAKEPVGFDKTKVECYNCHKTRHFAREYRSKGNQDSRRRDPGYLREQLGIAIIENSEPILKLLKKEAKKEKEELKDKVEKWHNSSKGLNILLNSQMSARDKAGLGYGNQMHKGVLSYENEVFGSVFDSRSSDIEDSPVNNRYAEGMHVVPPPMTGIYIPSRPDVEIDESQYTYGQKQSKSSESDAENCNFASCESNSSVETIESVPKPVANEPKAVSDPKVWSDAPIIEEYGIRMIHIKLQRTKRIAEGLFPGTLLGTRPTFPSGGLSYSDLTNTDQDDSQIPTLEDIYDNPSQGIFSNASYDDEGAVADFTNLDTTMNVSPIPTSRIHTIHPKTQILGDPTLAVQTRSKVNKSSGAYALFVDPKYPKKVYKVVKALYGLHQAPRAWFQVTPKTFHLHDVKRIFRYLKGKPKLGLWYPRVSSFDLEAYSDSDYARANLDRKSTTGGCQFLGRRLISWQCKKQTIMATFTTRQINDVKQIIATVDSKAVVVTEASIRSSLLFNDVDGFLPCSTIKDAQAAGAKEDLEKGYVSKHGGKKSKPESTLDASTVFDDQDADHGMEYMEIEEAVDEGRQCGETEEVKLTDYTEVVEDKGIGDKRGNAEELVSTARPEVSTATPDIDAARQEDSAVEPRTPPKTTSIFDDEYITMAQTLIKMNEEKAKEKGVSIKDVNDSSRPARSILTLKPLLTIDHKDKGASKMEGKERKTETGSSICGLQASLYVEFKLRRMPSEKLAARLTKEERKRDKQTSNNNTTEEYLKHTDKYRHNQLNKKTFEEIQALYIKEQERDADFVPIGSERDEKMIDKMNKKAAGMDEEELGELKMKATKNSKSKTDTESDDEEQLRASLKIVPDEEEEIDYEVLGMRCLEANEVSIYQDFTDNGFQDLLDGDLRIMFEVTADDDIWKNQEKWIIKSWTFSKKKFRGSYLALENGEAVFDLLRFIQKQIDEFGGQDGSEKDL
ncbi:hypothetical protein Tco_1172447 [Tanacetum coccineum]